MHQSVWYNLHVFCGAYLPEDMKRTMNSLVAFILLKKTPKQNKERFAHMLMA